MKVHMGFLTNNAGDDIAGSTIKWTLKNFYQYFDSCIVVDGRLTDQAKDFYRTIPNIVVVDSPWQGMHVVQYTERSNICPGDYLLGLDCDESPTKALAENIRGVCSIMNSRGIEIASPPAVNMWCKHNSNEYYRSSWFNPLKPPPGHKRLLYHVTPSLKYHSTQTGTHVTPINIERPQVAVLPYGHYHFKSPETTIFNSAICIMDDIKPLNEPADGGLRGLTMDEVNDLERLGTKYNLLGKENFRRATKSRAWPQEFAEYVKRFKYRSGHCRMLYTLYYVLLQGATDTEPLTYEDACEIGTLNQNYKVSRAISDPLVVPHTDVITSEIELPCGAG